MKKLVKHTSLLLLFSILLLSLSAFAEGSASDWAKEYIDSARQSKRLDSKFLVNLTSGISRKDIAYIAVSYIAAIYEKPVSEILSGADTLVFDDTTDEYVAAAYALGIMDGAGDGMFMPDRVATRQEAAKIIVNTYSFCEDTELDFDTTQSFSDSPDIAKWAVPYVNAVTNEGLMQGDDQGRFLPLENYTKEQGIAVFERMYKLISEKGGPVVNTNNVNPEISSMLYVKNGSFSNGSEDVTLNGVNLGGWLIMEEWMGPVSGKNIAYSDIIDTFIKRFGVEKAYELISTYEDNFITSEDFDIIEGLGFNCIRLPFWYRNFTDAEGKLLTKDDNQNPGFKRLDFVLDECEKHGIYVILDMHGCPGGQSTNHTTGTIDKNELYSKESNLKLMESLWTKIAGRYKNNSCVAAYDIMNEPFNNDNSKKAKVYQAESPEAIYYTNSIYDRMIKAIRKVDKNHIISVEGIWSMSVLPNPKTYGWTNMSYQLHLYDTSMAMIDCRVSELVSAREQYNIAPLVGEYNNKFVEKYASRAYNENDLSKIKWTYKTLNVNYDNWGLYNKAFKKLDYKTATFDELKQGFESLKTNNDFKFNTYEYNLIK